MKTLSTLPGNWASLALARALEQGYLPDSPAKNGHGEVALCAAACIAYAGLKLMSPGREAIFCAKLAENGDKQLVLNTFNDLGLAAETCVSTMVLNDKTCSDQRIKVLSGLLGM